MIVFVLIIAALLWGPMFMPQPPGIPYTTFKNELKKGNVEEITAKGEKLSGIFINAVQVERELPGRSDPEMESVKKFTTVMPAFGDEELLEQISRHHVQFTAREQSDGMGMWLLAFALLPLLILIGFGWMAARRARQSAGGLMSIGRSRAKRFVKERTSVSFDDVAGVSEAKQSLKEVIAFLTRPGDFTRLGCRVPKGVLLVGPPGTGKTLLARAVAGEAGVPFFSITGSDFMEMFVGVGASRVRDLFATAKRNSPCIIFLDELDSVGRHRGAGLGGGHDEREQTLNQLLSEIDGFEPNDDIVVMAASNRPDVLDPALLRPGRFDRQVVVDLPTLSEREQILAVHTRRVPLLDDVDLRSLAKGMPGRSGADLANLVNEAALLAAKGNKDSVGMAEFSEARDKILMGQSRGGIVLEGRERTAIALHEAGHALVAHLCHEADIVSKVSIIPRGRALGVTQQLPEEHYTLTRGYLIAKLKVMLGGRASEQIMLDDISTGAADDLNQATRLARRMVNQWGMSESLQNVAFGDGDQEIFLGEQLAQRREYSEETAREIDLAVKKIIDLCYDEAMHMLSENRERLQAIADALEAEETLEGERLMALLNGTPRSVPN